MERRDFIKKTSTVLTATAAATVASRSSTISAQGSAQTVLITGAGSGFGQRMAVSFARQGYRVYATMRDPNGRKSGGARYLSDLASVEGLSIFIEELDVTNREQSAEVVEKVMQREGRIDILINNAGIIVYTPVEVAPTELWQLQMDTNVFGPMNLAGLVLPHMRHAGSGLIIQVSSRVGRAIIPGIGLYSTSKSTFEAATEAAYYESTPLNIDFAIIQPTAFRTEVNANAGRIFRNISLPLMERLRPSAAAHYRDFLNKLERDFSGTPTRDPQEVADLALNIARTPSYQRVLRYTVGDDFELNAVRELNEHHAQKQEEALRNSGYQHLYRR